MASYGCRVTKWRCMQRAASFSMLVLSISSSRADQKDAPADAHDRQQRRDGSVLSAVVESNRPFFIQDPTDGLCLGGSTFKRCAVDTLWELQGDALRQVVRRMAVRDDGEEDVKQPCLVRKNCDTPTSALRTASCDHCGASGWRVIGDDSGYTLTTVESVQAVMGSTVTAAASSDTQEIPLLQASVSVSVPNLAGGTISPLELSGRRRGDMLYEVCMVMVRDGEGVKMDGCGETERVTLQFVSEEDMSAISAPGVRLITAASDGDKRSVKRWIEEGADVDSRDWDNLTPLIAASSQGHLDVVKLLLQRGAGLDCRDKDNITALMEASIMDHRDVVKHLLKEGAEVDAKTTTGVTALWLAAGEGRREVVAALIASGADVNNSRTDGITAVMAAALGGHKEVVKMLVEASAGASEQDTDGLTALMNAAEIGAVEIVTYLLQHGADPNVMSETGFTALILASAGGHVEVVKTLVEKGAEINAEHPEGVNALMYGAAGAHLGVVQYLLQPGRGLTGAEVNQIHIHGGSALLEASTSGNVDVIQILLNKGGDVSIRDKDGVTALMSSASHGHAKACEVLLDAGANLEAKSSSGATALMFASAAGYTDVVKLLLARGADANARVEAAELYKTKAKGGDAEDSRGVEVHIDGVTSLMVAAAGGHMELMEVLVEAGADVTAEDERGSTALLNAVKGNLGDAALYLVEKGANPNDVYLDEGGDPHSLLMDAIVVENVPFAELLVKHGADVSVTDEQGVTTLIKAAHRGMFSICELLLDKEVDVEAMSEDGFTALIAGASGGHAHIVELLLEKGKANPNARDKDGATALMAASVQGHKDVVDVLLKHSADVNQENVDGDTALMFAYNGRNQVSALLSRYLEYVGGKEDDGNARIIQDSLKVHSSIIAALEAAGAGSAVLESQNSALELDARKSRSGFDEGIHSHNREEEGVTPRSGRLEVPHLTFEGLPPPGDREEL